jgi:ERCC4-type nuclease
MILDDREPTSILDKLRSHGLEVSHTRLDSADCAWSGCGPDSTSVMIGVERKKLGDLINSMKDRRLSGRQLREMWQTYDYVFLTVEGVWRPGPGGEIEELRGRDWVPCFSRGYGASMISYRQVTSYLTTLEMCGGVVVRRTSSEIETAAMWASLYHWWQKPWADHRSHDQLYHPVTLPNKNHGSKWADPHSHDEEYEDLQGNHRGRVVAGVENPTTAWRWASDLPGVDRRAKGVAEFFGSAYALALGEPGAMPSEDRLVRMEVAYAAALGIEKGRKTAKAVVRAVTETGG